jgi:hypothetical protein
VTAAVRYHLFCQWQLDEHWAVVGICDAAICLVSVLPSAAGRSGKRPITLVHGLFSTCQWDAIPMGSILARRIYL